MSTSPESIRAVGFDIVIKARGVGCQPLLKHYIEAGIASSVLGPDAQPEL